MHASGPEADVTITNISYNNGAVTVVWQTSNKDNVMSLQLEYNCSNVTGHSVVRMFLTTKYNCLYIDLLFAKL